VSEQTGQHGDVAGGGLPAADVPRDDQPGGESTPLDTEGDGPVGLQDRMRTDEKGSPATNQGKAEPMPPAPGHRDPAAPLVPPALDEMTVGATDPQRPSLGAAAPTSSAEAGPADGPSHAPRDLSGPGEAPFETRPTVDGTSPTGTDRGPEVPGSASAGRSHRAPGLQGRTSPAEQVETDVEDSAAAMVRDTGRPAGSGDPHGVESVGETPSQGTSEEHGVVQGARIPRSDGASQG
jgi:hypothetical protein